MADLPTNPNFLIEAFPFDPSSRTVVPYYWSLRPFTSEPIDTPANQYYDDVATQPNQTRSSLFSGNNVMGKSDAARGAILIANPADQVDALGNRVGRYDGLQNFAWTGRRVRILAGADGAPYASYRVILDGSFSGQPASPSKNVISLAVSNNLDLMNRRMQPNLYAGTGGAEGDGTIAGKCKPRGFGIAREVPGVLVNAPLNIYQLHDGPFGSVLACYDGGVAISNPSADWPTFAALAGATVAPGSVATCLAGGYVRLGGTPSHPVSFDLQFTSALSVGRVAEAIMIGCFGYAAGVNYDGAAVAALDALQPAVAGYWAGSSPVNGLTALDAVLGGAGCWYTAARTGLVTMGRLDAPTITGPNDPACVLVLTDNDIVENGLTRATPPDPPYGFVVGYRPFYQTQTSGYGSVSNQRIADLGTQFRTALAVNPNAADWPNGETLRPNSQFDQAADAAAEAARLVALHCPARNLPRRTFTAVCLADPYKTKLGDQVWLSHPRENLAAGAAFVVIGLAEDAGSATPTVTLTLWG